MPESWQDLYRRSYWDELRLAREDMAAYRKSLNIEVLRTPHGTLNVIQHELFDA